MTKPLPDGVSTSRRSLDLERELRFNEWQRIGEQLEQLIDSAHWWLADWWVYGVKRFGEFDPENPGKHLYDQGIEEMRRRRPHLDVHERVGRRFAVDDRRVDVTFDVYNAAVRSPEPQAWLADAFEDDLSPAQVRASIAKFKRSGAALKTSAQAEANERTCNECGTSIERKRVGSVTCGARCRKRRERRLAQV